MDPLTQGVVGALASQQLAKPKLWLSASVLGFLSGLAPDLDIFLRSDTDPLLALEYHRQFTHSLFFVPIGGLLCALFFYGVMHFILNKKSLPFKTTYLYCTLGYATHGLLDACTTYGTQLLWPLSDMRVAWNTISIIDPLYTLPLLSMIVLAAVYRSKKIAAVGLCWLIAYSVFGIIQRERAETFAWELAATRGHQPITLEAKPSFANLLVWKVVYSTDDLYYVDAVRAGWGLSYYEGQSIPKLDVSRDFPDLATDSQQAKDIERFRWFSNGYLAVSPVYENRIIDIRFSFLPNEIRGLWGIEIDPSLEASAHVNYLDDRTRDSQTFTNLWRMLVGEQSKTLP